MPNIYRIDDENTTAYARTKSDAFKVSGPDSEITPVDPVFEVCRLHESTLALERERDELARAIRDVVTDYAFSYSCKTLPCVKRAIDRARRYFPETLAESGI